MLEVSPYKWFSLTVVNDSYYKLVVLENVEIDVSRIKEIVAAQEELGGKRLPMLFIFNQYTTTNTDALKYFADDENFPYSTTEAFILMSLPQRLMGNFYVKLNKPRRAVRFLKNKQEVAKWLKEVACLVA